MKNTEFTLRSITLRTQNEVQGNILIICDGQHLQITDKELINNNINTIKFENCATLTVIDTSEKKPDINIAGESDSE